MRPATNPSIVAIRCLVASPSSAPNATCSKGYRDPILEFSYDRCQAGKVEEEEGGDDLRVEAVSEVGQVVRPLPLKIVDESPEEAASPDEARNFPAPSVCR